MSSKCHQDVTVSSHNFVDKDMQSMLYPIDFMQTVYFCPKYRIKDDRILPTNVTLHLFALSGLTMFVCLYMYRTYSMHYIIDQQTTLYIFSYYDIFSFSLGLVLNYIIHVVRTRRNILFILNLQEVHRNVNDEKSFKRFSVENWAGFVCYISLYISVNIFVTIYLQIPVMEFICGFIIMCFDMNMILASRFIKLLCDKIVLWNGQLKNLKWSENDSEIRCDVIFQDYVNILDCYDMFKSTYHLLVLYHVSDFVCRVLMRYQVSLEVLKNGLKTNDFWIPVFLLLFIYFWMSKSLFLEIYLNVCCEHFYSLMDEVQDSCVFIMSSECTDADKRVCKNIQRLHQSSFYKMSACGMFSVDATFPLKIVSLISTYNIVLLQFAFLN